MNASRSILSLKKHSAREMKLKLLTGEDAVSILGKEDVNEK